MPISTMTSKGQTTVPKEVRESRTFEQSGIGRMGVPHTRSDDDSPRAPSMFPIRRCAAPRLLTIVRRRASATQRF
jgi:hypothetical protein